MAVPSWLDTTTSTSNINSLQSGSFAPTGNALLIVAVRFAHSDENDELDMTISDTFAGTGSWRQDTIQLDSGDGAAEVMRLSIFTAVLGATPGEGTVTADITSADITSRSIMHSHEVEDFDSTTPVEQAASNKDGDASAGDITATFGESPASDSLVYGAYHGLAGAPVTPDSNFTELVETTIGAGGGEFCGQSQYDEADADTTTFWDYDSDDNAVCLAIEINADSGGTETATVAPVGLTLIPTSTTATYIQVDTAAVAPIAITLTPTATTATYIQVGTAAVVPITLTLTPTATTAIGVETATVAPVTTILTILSITATYIQVEAATVVPVGLTFTPTSTTATYIQVETAAVIPVGLTLTPTSTTASGTGIDTATVVPIAITLTPTSTTATDRQRNGGRYGGSCADNANINANVNDRDLYTSWHGFSYTPIN